MTPTKAGEGKTTTSVALTQGLGYIGKSPVLCLREASLGPVFGIKGGAAGGGLAQVVPMEDLNLHFTGDIHAIGAANNLLAAMLDASILHGNPHNLDALQVTWKRAVDMNDRALRQIAIGLGGPTNGYPRESGFDITAASEVMAIVAVARDLHDLRKRLGAITVGYSHDGQPVTAEDLGAAGAMAVLLKDAIKPNLIQTLEGQPCLMHAGPFANIAHGNSSLIADLMGLKLGDYVVTESGFGSDMGMEKFIDIVCRAGGINPDTVVLVSTVRALKHHGGLDDPDGASAKQQLEAVEKGMANLAAAPGDHQGVRRALRGRASTAAPRTPTRRSSWSRSSRAEAGAFGSAISEGFAKGGEGVADLAETVVAACDEKNSSTSSTRTRTRSRPRSRRSARGSTAPRRSSTTWRPRRRSSSSPSRAWPSCRSAWRRRRCPCPPTRCKLGAPTDFQLPVRDVRAYTGAGWLVPLCGAIQQMPGLGKTPAAFNVDIDAEGRTVGLF